MNRFKYQSITTVETVSWDLNEIEILGCKLIQQWIEENINHSIKCEFTFYV